MKSMARSMGGIDWPAVRDILGLGGTKRTLVGPGPTAADDLLKHRGPPRRPIPPSIVADRSEGKPGRSAWQGSTHRLACRAETLAGCLG
jgi:hypothetical protein